MLICLAQLQLSTIIHQKNMKQQPFPSFQFMTECSQHNQKPKYTSWVMVESRKELINIKIEANYHELTLDFSSPSDRTFKSFPSPICFLKFGYDEQGWTSFVLFIILLFYFHLFYDNKAIKSHSANLKCMIHLFSSWWPATTP